jgi:hypothetical protein
VRRLVPTLAGLLLCAACAVPVFDPAMSAAVKALRVSHVIGGSRPTIGPDMNDDGKPDFDLTESLFTYMPERWAGAVTTEKGFVIRRREYDSWNQIWYQWWDGSEVRWLNSPAGYDEEEGVRWRWPVTPKNGSSLGAIIFEWSETESYLDRLHADTGTPVCDWNPAYHSYTTMEDDIYAQLPLTISTPVVVGMSVNALSLPGQDRLHALVREGAIYSEAEVLVSDTGIMGAFANSITPNEYPLPFLGTPRHVNYARDAVECRSYVQWIEDDAWRTGAWAGNIAGPTDIDDVVNIPHRIDAVLTTNVAWGWTPGSYILSTEDQVGRLYYYNGIGTEKQVAEFGIGTLRFIGEMYLNAEWQLLFSRALLDRTADPPTMRFEVRGIYTKDLLAEFGL